MNPRILAAAPIAVGISALLIPVSPLAYGLMTPAAVIVGPIAQKSYELMKQYPITNAYPELVYLGVAATSFIATSLLFGAGSGYSNKVLELALKVGTPVGVLATIATNKIADNWSSLTKVGLFAQQNKCPETPTVESHHSLQPRT